MSPENPLGRTRTEAVMSLYFDSCHRAAAEASKVAMEVMQTGPMTDSALRVVGETQTVSKPEFFRYVDYGWRQLGNVYNTQGYARIVLGHKASEDASEPQLLAVLRDSIAIPLAYFNERRDGACSYVRIGQEMRDENFVVTPRDDRHTIISALGQLIEHGLEPYNPLAKEEQAAILDLLAQEVEAHTEQINIQLAPVLVAQLRDMYADTKAEQPLGVRSMDGLAEPTLLHAQPFDSWPIVLDDGREVELLLTTDEPRPAGKKSWRPSRMKLTAVVRGDLAWDVLSFDDAGVCNAQTGEPLPYEDINTLRGSIAFSNSRNRYKSMQEAKDKLTVDKMRWLMAKVQANSYEGPASPAGFAALASVIFPEAQLAERVRKIDVREYEEKKSRLERTLLSGEPTYQTIMDGCRNSMPGKFWPDITLVEKYAEASRAYYSERQKVASDPHTLAIAEIVQSTDLAVRMQEQIGVYRPKAEALLKRVHELSLLGSLFEGVWKDAPLLKHTSDIDIKVNITHPETEQIRVELGIRPSSEDNLPHEPIFDVLFDRLAQVEIEEDDVAELQHHLDLVSLAAPVTTELHESRRMPRLISQLLSRQR